MHLPKTKDIHDHQGKDQLRDGVIHVDAVSYDEMCADDGLGLRCRLCRKVLMAMRGVPSCNDFTITGGLKW
jgi:hypothetical protein